MSLKRQLLLMSSSNVCGHGYLEHAKDLINNFLNKHNVKTILFLPYALKDYDAYTSLIEKAFSKWGFKVEGIHKKSNVTDAVNTAEAIFIGGGNTFVLLKTLYEMNLIECIRKRVLNDGIPYMGSSAGTNVATLSIHTTNDMPVVYPPSFEALKLVPFNINPHYIESDKNSSHRGETRDQRIIEFIEYNDRPVLGLREGSYLLVDDKNALLMGAFPSKLFNSTCVSEEIPPGTDLSWLLTE